MLRRVTLVLAAVLAACGPNGPRAEQTRADSSSATAAGESTVAADAAARSDSGRLARSAEAAPLAPSRATPPVPTGATPGGGQELGRDSAFGPTFTVDSTGKVTPIVPVKKKP